MAICNLGGKNMAAKKKTVVETIALSVSSILKAPSPIDWMEAGKYSVKLRLELPVILEKA